MAIPDQLYMRDLEIIFSKPRLGCQIIWSSSTCSGSLTIKSASASSASVMRNHPTSNRHARFAFNFLAFRMKYEKHSNVTGSGKPIESNENVEIFKRQTSSSIQFNDLFYRQRHKLWLQMWNSPPHNYHHANALSAIFGFYVYYPYSVSTNL